MGKKNTTGNVPKTKAKKPDIIEEKLLFKKSQKRLLQELTTKHQKELNEVITEILEDEGMIDKIKDAERTQMIPEFEGIIIFRKDKNGG